MSITSVQKLNNQRKQFRGIFNNVIEYEAVWDPASVLPNGDVHESISIPGAQMGSFVMVSSDIDLQHMIIHGYVESAGSVSVGLHNDEASAIDLPAHNIHIIILRPTHSIG